MHFKPFFFMLYYFTPYNPRVFLSFNNYHRTTLSHLLLPITMFCNLWLLPIYLKKISTSLRVHTVNPMKHIRGQKATFLRSWTLCGWDSLLKLQWGSKFLCLFWFDQGAWVGFILNRLLLHFVPKAFQGQSNPSVSP